MTAEELDADEPDDAPGFVPARIHATGYRVVRTTSDETTEVRLCWYADGAPAPPPTPEIPADGLLVVATHVDDPRVPLLEALAQAFALLLNSGGVLFHYRSFLHEVTGLPGVVPAPLSLVSSRCDPVTAVLLWKIASRSADRAAEYAAVSYTGSPVFTDYPLTAAEAVDAVAGSL